MRPVDAFLVSGTTRHCPLRGRFCVGASRCLQWVAQGRTEGASRFGAGPAMRDRLLYLILIANVLVVAGLGAKTVYEYRAFRTLNDEGRMASAIVRDVRPAVRNRLAGRGRWILDYSFTTEELLGGPDLVLPVWAGKPDANAFTATSGAATGKSLPANGL